MENEYVILNNLYKLIKKWHKIIFFADAKVGDLLINILVIVI